MKTILVSACLLGAACRYDGKSKPSPEIIALRDKYNIIPVCPEIYGGLPTPRVPCEIKDGVMLRGLIVRHLLLPRGTGEAIRVFDWVRENAPDAYFSIMSQYTPCGRVGITPELNRRITRREYEKVLSHICESDFDRVYFQEPSSAGKEYVPPFDLTGV